MLFHVSVVPIALRKVERYTAFRREKKKILYTRGGKKKLFMHVSAETRLCF